MAKYKSNNEKGKKSHPCSKYFKQELSKRLRIVISTFPEVKTINSISEITYKNPIGVVTDSNYKA